MLSFGCSLFRVAFLSGYWELTPQWLDWLPAQELNLGHSGERMEVTPIIHIKLGC